MSPNHTNAKSCEYTWLPSGRHFLFLIRGPTVGLFWGVRGRQFRSFPVFFWGSGGFGPELNISILNSFQTAATYIGGRWAFISQTRYLTVKFRILVGTRRRSGQNRSESVCAGPWVPCQVLWAWFCCLSSPNPARNRKSSGRAFKSFLGSFS